jgi:aspartate carbamoyltransferase catalytic subunit
VHIVPASLAARANAAISRCEKSPGWAGHASALAGRNCSPYSPAAMQGVARNNPFPHRHLLGIEGLSPDDITFVLDLADGYVELNRQAEKKRALLRGRTIINCFFENSTRTRTSFEVAGKRLGGDVINMSVKASLGLKPASAEVELARDDNLHSAPALL